MIVIYPWAYGPIHKGPWTRTISIKASTIWIWSNQGSGSDESKYQEGRRLKSRLDWAKRSVLPSCPADLHDRPPSLHAALHDRPHLACLIFWLNSSMAGSLVSFIRHLSRPYLAELPMSTLPYWESRRQT